MSFSELFNQQYKSKILCDYLEKIIREMAELKRKNYYVLEEVKDRVIKIDMIKEALKELNIDISDDFDPEDLDEGR